MEADTLDAIKSLAKHKSLELDRFNAKFLLFMWEATRADVISHYKEFHRDYFSIGYLNHLNIELVFKSDIRL